MGRLRANLGVSLGKGDFTQLALTEPQRLVSKHLSCFVDMHIYIYVEVHVSIYRYIHVSCFCIIGARCCDLSLVVKLSVV